MRILTFMLTKFSFAIFFVPLFVMLNACAVSPEQQVVPTDKKPVAGSGITLYVLGTLQDGGAPHMGCTKPCCSALFKQPKPQFKVVSLGLADAVSKKNWLFEATPDIATQLKQLKALNPAAPELPAGVFLTHAHIGHYSGLMFFGREAMNTKKVPVYAMPRMKQFLESNGPWSQLVALENITLVRLKEDAEVTLRPGLSVTPFCVPHRDEFSETVGYKISGPNTSVLFIPDIDKWQKWRKSIVEEIQKVDYAFIDATFYSGEEIGHRPIAEIPHPFVIESMETFAKLPVSEKKKIRFTHFNHTNPLLRTSDQLQALRSKGFEIAQFLDSIPL